MLPSETDNCFENSYRSVTTICNTVACVALILASATVTAQTDVASQDYVWQYDAFNDPEYKGRYTVSLVYGIPETDNVQLQGTCTTQGHVAILGANTGELSNSESVPVNFYQNGDKVYTAQGAVYSSEEGISGVLFQLEANDGLWLTLQSGYEIRYEVSGLPREYMHLRGSTRAIRNFRKDCSAIQNAYAASLNQPATAESGDDLSHEELDHEENNTVSAPSCDIIDAPASPLSDETLTIQFSNNSGGYRSVLQRGNDGSLQHQKDLAHGESYSQPSRVGQQWMLVDGPGNCKEIFVPSSTEDTEFSILFAD